MDAITRLESEYATRSQEGAVTFLRPNSEAITPGAEVSVMILHADPIIAAGLAAVLRECCGFQIAPTAEHPNPDHDLPPTDVVIVDYETALRVAESAPQWTKHLVVFTNHDSEAKIYRALESGVRGYLLHGVGLAELFEAIRSVRRGGVALSPLAAARITNRFQGRTLTPREKAVLEQLTLGLSNKAIARKLALGLGTVKSHVKAILGKLDADCRTAAVMTAQRRGLLP